MVNSFAGSESPLQMSAVSCTAPSVGRSKSSSLRRRKRPGRHSTERQTSIEKHNGEVSTSASGEPPALFVPYVHPLIWSVIIFVNFRELICPLSDGGGGTAAGSVELEVCPCGGPHSWLVPAMLSPPESLLMSCIRRGNFMEARQVSVANWTQQPAQLIAENLFGFYQSNS